MKSSKVFASLGLVDFSTKPNLLMPHVTPLEEAKYDLFYLKVRPKDLRNIENTLKEAFPR